MTALPNTWDSADAGWESESVGPGAGRWEGGTLVVESNGLNTEGWLDLHGRPQTDHRRDFGHINLQLIIDDPTAYSKRWGASLHLDYVPDDELVESICENEKDFSHLVGK